MPRFTNAQMLRRAANIMKKRGHAKQALEDDKGRVCLLGAIALAVDGNAEGYSNRTQNLLDRVGGYLTSKLGARMTGCDAVSWNNEHKRKAGDVIAALRGAASMCTRNQSRAA